MRHRPGHLGILEAVHEMKRHVDPGGHARAGHNVSGVDPALPGAHIHVRVPRRKLDRARELLETTHSTISHISQTCGLGTPANFRQHFRRTTGTTPSEYRQTFTTT
ncbi:hypothetical protein SMALB_0329 [Streptomyces malaysiensis]|uniref:HTH araC/xylS-type domain-containing protein n=2 Tax=Streptomyces malaysiensis TaxID=92644 RepID=A0A7X5WX94_STRMQ|nr:hypothetical protein [Streptomyces malaysiensis]